MLLRTFQDKGKDDAYADSGRRLTGMRDKTLPTRFDAPDKVRIYYFITLSSTASFHAT